jgi:hypothetical protein
MVVEFELILCIEMDPFANDCTRIFEFFSENVVDRISWSEVRVARVVPIIKLIIYLMLKTNN